MMSHDPEGQGFDPKMFCAQYLKTAGDTDFSAMEHRSYMGHGESNGHVSDDVTLPRKVKVVTPLCLMPIMLKTSLLTDIDRRLLFVRS